MKRVHCLSLIAVVTLLITAQVLSAATIKEEQKLIKTYDFSEQSLAEEIYYFEPFQSYIKKLTKDNKFFFFDEVEESKVLFNNGDFFVISTESLSR